jgi:hypothetical protein
MTSTAGSNGSRNNGSGGGSTGTHGFGSAPLGHRNSHCAEQKTSFATTKSRQTWEPLMYVSVSRVDEVVTRTRLMASPVRAFIAQQCSRLSCVAPRCATLFASMPASVCLFSCLFAAFAHPRPPRGVAACNSTRRRRRGGCQQRLACEGVTPSRGAVDSRRADVGTVDGPRLRERGAVTARASSAAQPALRASVQRLRHAGTSARRRVRVGRAVDDDSRRRLPPLLHQRTHTRERLGGRVSSPSCVDRRHAGCQCRGGGIPSRGAGTHCCTSRCRAHPRWLRRRDSTVGEAHCSGRGDLCADATGASRIGAAPRADAGGCTRTCAWRLGQRAAADRRASPHGAGCSGVETRRVRPRAGVMIVASVADSVPS